MSKKLLLLGGGGHCKSVLDSLLAYCEYEEIGIIDQVEDVGKSILGVPIIGCDEDLIDLHHKGYTHGFVTVGSIGNPRVRIRLFEELESIGFQIPNIVDPSAVISKNTTMEKGIYIGKNVTINVESWIKNGAIINTSSTIEHECRIGEFSHIAPGTVLCGNVEIGQSTHVGAGCVVKQQVNIGKGCLIGAGSVVLQDIADHKMAFGNPCKEVRKI